jgi:hypothetical protein
MYAETAQGGLALSVHSVLISSAEGGRDEPLVGDLVVIDCGWFGGYSVIVEHAPQIFAQSLKL